MRDVERKKYDRDKLKETFNRPRRIKYQICAINSQIASLEDCLLPGAIRYDTDRVDSSPSDRMPQVMAEIADLCTKQKRLERELFEAQKQVKDICESIDDDLERTVLLMRFIGCQTFEQIGLELSYDKSGAWRAYDRAIKSLTK